MHKIPTLILALLLLASNLIVSPMYAKNSVSTYVSATVLESITTFTLNGQIVIQTNSDRGTVIQNLAFLGNTYRTYSLTY
jgi:hypothetical protein